MNVRNLSKMLACWRVQEKCEAFHELQIVQEKRPAFHELQIVQGKTALDCDRFCDDVCAILAPIHRVDDYELFARIEAISRELEEAHHWAILRGADSAQLMRIRCHIWMRSVQGIVYRVAEFEYYHKLDGARLSDRAIAALSLFSDYGVRNSAQISHDPANIIGNRAVSIGAAEGRWIADCSRCSLWAAKLHDITAAQDIINFARLLREVFGAKNEELSMCGEELRRYVILAHALFNIAIVSPHLCYFFYSIDGRKTKYSPQDRENQITQPIARSIITRYASVIRALSMANSSNVVLRQQCEAILVNW